MDEIDHNRQQGQARQLAEALLARRDDAACAACLDALEEYVAAQLTGDDYAARWPAVAAHLDACVACTESYALLYAARLAERVTLTPANMPTPDLSFLQAGAAGPLAPATLRDERRAAQLRQTVAATVVRAGAQLRLTLSQALLDLLPPPAGPALAFRGGGGPALFELALDESEGAVERLSVSAYTDPETVERCVVRVQVALHGREWPDLAGIRVVLLTGEARRAAATDAWGEAVFEDVPAAALPELVVEVDASV
jgi:hypothetical protein